MKCVSLTLVAGFVAWTVSWPAQAEIINIKCPFSKLPAYSHLGLAFWIDLEKNTITYKHYDNQRVLIDSGETNRVHITPEEFNFTSTSSRQRVTINRMTGVNTWSGGLHTQIYECSKGTLPFPTTKF